MLGYSKFLSPLLYPQYMHLSIPSVTPTLPTCTPHQHDYSNYTQKSNPKTQFFHVQSTQYLSDLTLACQFWMQSRMLIKFGWTVVWWMILCWWVWFIRRLLDLLCWGDRMLFLLVICNVLFWIFGRRCRCSCIRFL